MWALRSCAPLPPVVVVSGFFIVCLHALGTPPNSVPLSNKPDSNTALGYRETALGIGPAGIMEGGQALA